jgi:small-conductance mechanosensitive channel
MPQSLNLRLAALIVMLLALLSGAAAQDQGQTNIDGWNARLDQIEATLRRPNLTTNDLASLRTSTQSIEDEARALVATLQPQIAASEARLRSLTPEAEAPQAGAESEAVTTQRDQQNALLANLNGIARQADLVATRAEQLLQTIAERRNLNFTSRLFQYGPSLLSPSLWQEVVGQLPDVLTRAGRLFADWFNLVYARADIVTLLFLILVAFLAPVVVMLGRRLLRRVTDRLSASQAASEGRKIFAATLIVAMSIALPAIFVVIVSAIFDAFGFLPPRMRLAFNSLLFAIIALTLINGLALAVLAPTRPVWRLVALDNSVAARLYGSILLIALLAAAVPLVDGLSTLTAAPPSIPIAIGGCLAVAIAVMILIATRSLSGDAANPDSPGAPGGKLWRWASTFASVGALIAIFSAIAGHIAFARFLTAQIIWAAIVLAGYAIVSRLIDLLITQASAPDRPAGRWLIASVGFSRRALGQTAVIITGVLRVLLIILAVVMIAAPWGFDSVSLAESARSLFYGVTIGSITITFSTIIAAVAVFAIGIVVTRFVQGWLENRLLPTTSLDPGLQNSIRTAIGYSGVIVAALLAGAYSGLDLANIAIVAGALSVGIGFGLQSIVNNFVSGLILLAERPIRVGDWIMVGTEEGTVRRINVRSTEIETFDRATLIIPNSTLITGNVKNLVLRDRSGRIIVPVSVGIGADPVKVKELLVECARSHPKVLGYPEPDVFLMDFHGAQLDLELRCFLAEVSDGMRVRSDLRFAILAKLREADIERPTALPALPGKSFTPPAEA